MTEKTSNKNSFIERDSEKPNSKVSSTVKAGARPKATSKTEPKDSVDLRTSLVSNRNTELTSKRNLQAKVSQFNSAVNTPNQQSPKNPRKKPEEINEKAATKKEVTSVMKPASSKEATIKKTPVQDINELERNLESKFSEFMEALEAFEKRKGQSFKPQKDLFKKQIHSILKKF